MSTTTPGGEEHDFTVFCRDLNDPVSTTWIEHIKAHSAHHAAELGRSQCADTWDYAREDVAVVGVAHGNVQIALWDDAGCEV